MILMNSKEKPNQRGSFMNTLRRVRGVVTAVAVGVLLLSSANTSADAQSLDATWTVTINGQTAPVYPNGSFRVPNVQADDNFGPGGPGTFPDGIADDWTRVLATRVVAGETEYAFSEPFKIVQGGKVRVENFTFTTSPPPLPVAITLTADTNAFPVGSALQLTVTGTLPDGSSVDLTSTSDWTSYRVSNSSKAIIDDNGLITGLASGSVLVVAMNEGVVATKSFFVQQPAPVTTLMGHTRLSNGALLPGVTVEVQSLGLITTSDANGFFSIADVPADVGLLTVDADVTIGPDLYVGSNLGIVPNEGGISDVGIVTMHRGPEFLASNVLGATGDTVTAGVVINAEQDIGGVSFGLCHDPAELLLLSEGATGAALLGSGFDLISPDFVSIVDGDDGIAAGIVISIAPPTEVLSPGLGVSVMNLEYLILGAAGSTSSLDFCEEIQLPTGPFAISLVFSDPDGAGFTPLSTSGTVIITSP